jgi:hypothetical protein
MKTSGRSLWETKYKILFLLAVGAWWAGTSIPIITGVPGLYCTDTENRYCLTGIRIIPKILIGIIVGVQAYQV